MRLHLCLQPWLLLFLFYHRFLNDRCTMILQRYYEKKGHQKKVLRGGADKIQDMKREFLGMASKAGVNSETVSYGGETFLSSEDVAVNILQLTKEAFRRCQTLSNSKDLAQNSVEIFDKLIGFLLIEHVDYALVCYFRILNFVFL